MPLFPYDFLFFCFCSYLLFYFHLKNKGPRPLAQMLCLVFLPACYWMLRTGDWEGLGFYLDREVFYGVEILLASAFFGLKWHEGEKNFSLSFQKIFFSFSTHFFFRQMILLAVGEEYIPLGLSLGIVGSVFLKSTLSWQNVWPIIFESLLFAGAAIAGKSFLFSWAMEVMISYLAVLRLKRKDEKWVG